GYGVAAACRLDTPTRRALSFEVGLQNSGLASTLATTYFSPLAALPGAVFSVWHNVSGALLASVFARRPYGKPPADGSLGESEPAAAVSENLGRWAMRRRRARRRREAVETKHPRPVRPRPERPRSDRPEGSTGSLPRPWRRRGGD